VCVVGLLLGAARAEDAPSAKGEAPPNQVVYQQGLGGAYFVPRPLKEQYDRLVAKVRALQAEIMEGRIDSQDAKREVLGLQRDLSLVRQQLEAAKTLVQAGKVHRQTETITFELGKERCLFIAAGRVRIVGWDQPQVKCVLEKTVLSAGGEPVEDDFRGIKLVHRHGRAREEVGATREEFEADEKKRKGPPSEARKKLIEEILAYNAPFQPFQGKEIDLVAIQGLTHQEGNRQISFDLESPGGEGVVGHQWRRHASLTVYAPACRKVGLHGGRGGLTVESLKTGLVVRGGGDRGYEGEFKIKDVLGPVSLDNVPIQTIENIQGNVSVTLTEYPGNSGTRHDASGQTFYVEPPEPSTFSNIQGDLQAWFVRANVALSKVGGKVDVKNEFGDTAFTIDGPLAPKAHRILSESGRIDVQFAGKALGSLPLLAALTGTGVVRVAGEAGEMEMKSVNFAGPLGPEWGRRGWKGFTSSREPFAGLAQMQRMPAILSGGDRPPGLDLISRNGTIRLVLSP
jgi:hypothetical protein